MQPGRVKKIMDRGIRTDGDFVFYWMQSAQRLENNHALEIAIQLANRYQKPLYVGFVLLRAYPNANQRHFEFMLQGIAELQVAFDALGIGFSVFEGLSDAFYECVHHSVAVVTDKSYGNYLNSLKQTFMNQMSQDVYEVDTNLVIPVSEAYPKEAYGAYVIRPSIQKKMPTYEMAFERSVIQHPFSGGSERLKTDALIKAFLESLPILGKTSFLGGEKEALRRLDVFLESSLEDYDVFGGNPTYEKTSLLSPYLHFGQISSITILDAIRKKGRAANGFVEQLVVRRELAYNFVHFNSGYDRSLEAFLPEWALVSLKAHDGDKRPYIYTLESLEQAQTHDPYWNAAQIQMVSTGHMHNYMRMYWGKKIIEWTASHEDAFGIMLYLNDKYQLDGRDPNGYTGIAWCFGKHDRAFTERPIFGKIRYMNDAGLKRKFNMTPYVEKWKG